MKNRGFCVLPFFSLELADPKNSKKNIYCCRIQPNIEIESVRQDILVDRYSSACSTCWKLEDQGLVSERMLHNSSLDFYWDRDINIIEDDVISGKFGTRIVKLQTSNLCNGTCVTCGPQSSTAWANLVGQSINYEKISPEDLSYVNWGEVISLGFVGGEPLLEKNNFQILENLLAIGNDRCFINIVTNGSIKLSQKQIETLSGFHNLNLCLSIDGIKDRFNYLRFPLQWEDVQENLSRFKDVTDNLSVSCMISNLSVLYLDETLDWFRDMDLKYLCKQIDHPEHFAPGNLPESIKLNLLANTKYPQEMQTFLNCGRHNSNLWQNFWNDINRQDRLKNISFKDYLPDLLLTRND